MTPFQQTAWNSYGHQLLISFSVHGIIWGWNNELNWEWGIKYYNRIRTTMGSNIKSVRSQIFLWHLPFKGTMVLIDWLIGILLVSKSGFVEVNAVQVFHHHGVHLTPLSWCKISSTFTENNNVVVLSFVFFIFMLLANLWLIRLQ